MGISLECSSCPRLAGLLNRDNDPGRCADGGNQSCYNSISAGHCSLPWSESRQGQAPAQSGGFSSAGLFFHFKGNPHLLMALAFQLPLSMAQVGVLEIFTSRFYGTDSLTECESQPGGFGQVTPCLPGSHIHLFVALRLRVPHLALTPSPAPCTTHRASRRHSGHPKVTRRVACLTSLALKAQPCRGSAASSL